MEDQSKGKLNARKVCSSFSLLNPSEECLRAASLQVLERRRVAASADKEPVFVFRQLLPHLGGLLAADLVHVRV